MNNENNDNYENLSNEFNLFIDYLKHLEYKGPSFSKIKESYYKEEWNRKKIIHQELNQINFENPIKSIDENYLKDNFSDILLCKELKQLDILIYNKSKEKLLESQEKLGFVKKILDVFLDYYIKKKFNPIISSLNKLNFMEINIKASLDLISKTKLNQTKFKDKILSNQVKYLLLQQKNKNIIMVKSIINDILLFYKKEFSKIKENDQVSNLSYEILSDLNQEVKNTIRTFKSSSFNSKHSFLFLENIEKRIKASIKIITDKMDVFTNNILDISNNSYLEYFLLYLSISNIKTELYINVSI